MVTSPPYNGGYASHAASVGGAHMRMEHVMKAGIHPEYVEATVRCSCGNTFTTHSTRSDLHVELCNVCHPFFSGKQKLVDSGGRVERFQRRYGRRPAKAKAPRG